MVDVSEAILELLKVEPAQKASQLARQLGLTRTEVNQLLYGRLKGRVVQDKVSFAWSLAASPDQVRDVDPEPPQPDAHREPRPPARANTFRIVLHKPDPEAGNPTRNGDGPGADLFEARLLSHFARFVGQTETNLWHELAAGEVSASKHRYFLLAKLMLNSLEGMSPDVLDVHRIALKTVRMQADGRVQESMSFRNIDFDELVGNRRWEQSSFYSEISKSFLFCIFSLREGEHLYRFAGARFWRMPDDDLQEARRVWQLTRDKSRQGRYDELPTSTESQVAHVRTKGQNARDLIAAPGNQTITKRCFFLNKAYVQRVIRSCMVVAKKVN